VRVDQWWTVGPYRLEEVVDHPFDKITSGPMYRYAINGKISSEMFESLDRAIVAAVGERHMGPRGAGGNAVGTAADWFCVMVGMAETQTKQAPAEEKDGSAPIADRCLGSGRGWMAVGDSNSPACPRCGATPGALGVAKPERHGLGYLGHVPEHGLA
jgi:hypothetical protein